MHSTLVTLQTTPPRQHSQNVGVRADHMHLETQSAAPRARLVALNTMVLTHKTSITHSPPHSTESLAAPLGQPGLKALSSGVCARTRHPAHSKRLKSTAGQIAGPSTSSAQISTSSSSASTSGTSSGSAASASSAPSDALAVSPPLDKSTFDRSTSPFSISLARAAKVRH